MTIFVAKDIITMEDSMPRASAVAVADGRIVAVGSLDSLKSWIDARGAKIDRRFEDKVLMPGFIDPHVHPSLPAVLTQFPFLAPDDWELPTGTFPGATTPEAYLVALKNQAKEYFDDPDRDDKVPFISWGYHQLWHGEINRKKLNEIFGDKPVLLWHRSFHELIGNDAAYDLIGVTESDVANVEEADWESGRVWENGFVAVLPKLTFLFEPERYKKGMKNFALMLQQGGVTSAMDMGVGIFGDPEGEMALIKETMGKDVPARVVLTPIITYFIAEKMSPQAALKKTEEWEKGSTDNVIFDKHFKLMMDGAIYSGLSQYKYPGYLDGHEGVWMAPLDVTYDFAKTFWNAGYQLHAHTNGDKSAEALLDILRKLQEQNPRVDHRMTLEHFAYATKDQLKQMEALGMMVSANPYYQFILSDMYADKWLGEDRARNMVPLGDAQKLGINVSLHSDNPMAPLNPLLLAWTATNRTTIGGKKNNESQKLSLDEALQAITINAAWQMRMEDEIGSIRAGKKADFVVLEEDPYEVGPEGLKDIEIWGTVFEGKVYPLVNGVRGDSE
ncbi:hydrolase [Microbulbifer agarilyticus]|uniref:Hydrolase n=2 Tax=Microbulbifer agarilyticus TaxID=260552 RepID=A0A1Q2M9J6_9GAMM|nr:hydrolase [Microbulbifer agarilyticus]